MQFPTVQFSTLIGDKSRNLTISPCTLAELAPYQLQAIKEHLGFATKTDYFILKDEDGETLGFCGITFYRHKVIFKCDYVLPEFRGNGLWQWMFDYRKAIVREIPTIQYIEAVCTEMSINSYKREGAIEIPYNSHRFTKIHIPLERHYD